MAATKTVVIRVWQQRTICTTHHRIVGDEEEGCSEEDDWDGYRCGGGRKYHTKLSRRVPVPIEWTEQQIAAFRRTYQAEHGLSPLVEARRRRAKAIRKLPQLADRDALVTLLVVHLPLPVVQICMRRLFWVDGS